MKKGGRNKARALFNLVFSLRRTRDQIGWPGQDAEALRRENRISFGMFCADLILQFSGEELMYRHASKKNALKYL